VCQSFQIGQPHGLDLVVSKFHLFQLPQRDALRLEVDHSGAVANAARFAGTRHENLPLVYGSHQLYYEHMLIK
jgi:hypothetical protein